MKKLQNTQQKMKLITRVKKQLTKAHLDLVKKHHRKDGWRTSTIQEISKMFKNPKPIFASVEYIESKKINTHSLYYHLHEIETFDAHFSKNYDEYIKTNQTKERIKSIFVINFLSYLTGLPDWHHVMLRDALYDKMYPLSVVVKLGNIVATSSYCDDNTGEVHSDFVHITRETPKSFLITEWRPNHFGPDKFHPIEHQQKWITKVKLEKKLQHTLNRRIHPWKTGGCPVPYKNISEDEMLALYTMKNTNDTWNKLNQIGQWIEIC